VAAVSAPPPIVIQETKSFNLAEDKKDKPRSTENFESDAQKIGVILPITGKNATLGQRTLNAIRLGLGIEEKNSSFQLAIYDNQSNPDTAALGVEKLLRDNKVVAILGGLSSKEAQNLSAKAEFFQVPFFSFSQKSGLTDGTDYTFRNSVTPEMQAARLLQHAFKNLNAKRFAILYPNDAYGTEFANKYWDLVLAGGGEVVAAQPYDPKDTDLNIYVKKLVGTYYSDARIDDYRARQKEISDKKRKQKEAEPNKKRNTREHEAQENILLPVVDFDVLFVPDSGKALGQIMAFMKNNDVAQMTYQGTNLWNTSDLYRRVGNGGSSVFFVDASFTAEEQKKSDFHTKYVTKYGEEPTIVEAQVYEAARILKDAIGNSSIGRNSLAYQLGILGRKQGAYGEIRMNNNHEIERPLHIFSLSEGTIQKTE
jgi:ABC-type branched-subunit amino acid transport system substrate-binding protein